MHSIGKTLAELHVMLKLHEKGIPKKAETPVVLAIRKGKIQKDRKKPQGTKGKAKGKNKLAYAPKTKILPPPKRDNPTKDSICHHCKECDGLLQPTHDESHEKCKSCRSGKMARKPFPHQVERAKDLLGLVHTDGSALESVALIFNMVPTKKVDRTPYEIWHEKAPKLSYLRIWGCEALVKQDTPDKLDFGSIKCIFEYELGDLDEPPNFKVALADTESDKWLEAMNTEMQSMKDNQYLRNTKDIVLVYGAKPGDELKVSCYADKSAKHNTTAMFSIEAVYITAAKASMEAVWIRKFINGLGGIMPSNKRPMEMLCDNESALAIAGDLGILKGAKNFQRKYHYIRKVRIVLKCAKITKKGDNIHTRSEATKEKPDQEASFN
nr:zinc finger, CCHC-type [Tanacetum cinerariifolium]